VFAGDVGMWILDTDHVSFFLGGDLQVIERFNQITPSPAVTIITVQEVFNGWVSELNRPNVRKEELLKKYQRFFQATEFFKQVRILEFDEAAYNRYNTLLAQNELLRKKRLLQDMRIAAIALSVGATVVTRNRRDFELVPGLRLEDWTDPSSAQ
jgi:tRNA(fMet)-specific endonuclease VapC